MTDTTFTINPNGSIDLKINDVSIDGMIPYVDDQPIIPISFTVGPNDVTYHTDDLDMTISLREADDEMILSTELDLRKAVHDIEPLGDALLTGAHHVYVQGFGMEGPSGYHPIDNTRRLSYGLIGIEGNAGSICAFTADNRRFTTKFSVCSRDSLFTEYNRFVCGTDLENTVSGKVELPELHFIHADDIMTCMKRAAEMIASEMNARKEMPSAFHWCSWYYYYENMSQEILDKLLAGLDKDPVDFRYIQLDAGYVDHTGDWLNINERYPEGLGKAARDIIEAGYRAGIWIAPFMVGDKSETYREHPDWIVRNPDGCPYTVFRSYTEPKIWGNTDNDYFVLDTTNPDAFKYLIDVFKGLRDDGFTLFKIDFLLWCMVDTSKVVRYDMSRTSVEILRDVLAMIRDIAGEDGYILASIAPYMASIGYADGVRIAGDMGASWEGAYGPENLLRELPYDNYFNNIFWQNDPDSVMLRDFGTHLTEDETRSLALLQALSGGVITTSDPVPELSTERRKLLSFIRPTDERVHAEMPLLTTDNEEIVITYKLHDWNLLYVLNQTDHPVNAFYRMDELFGQKALFQYRYSWDDDRCVESEKISYFSDSIKPHGSVLLFVTEEPIKERPSNLWGRNNGFISN